MTYKLEPITHADQETIIKDAACDLRKQSRLTYALANRTFPDVWVVDRERNCYLFLRPLVTREDGLDYFAFVDGYMYGINKVGMYGHEVYFDEMHLPAAEVVTALQEEISLAFAVFGAFGTGPEDEPLYPLFTATKGDR